MKASKNTSTKPALGDPLQFCAVCSYERLFTQKDFDRRLGLAVVAVGAVLSPWTYGLSLLGCMLLDYGLYYIVPEITVCYGCAAIYRGFRNNPRHRAHDPLLAERYRREAPMAAIAPRRSGRFDTPAPLG